jgi:hypothetical protein
VLNSAARLQPSHTPQLLATPAPQLPVSRSFCPPTRLLTSCKKTPPALHLPQLTRSVRTSLVPSFLTSHKRVGTPGLFLTLACTRLPCASFVGSWGDGRGRVRAARAVPVGACIMHQTPEIIASIALRSRHSTLAAGNNQELAHDRAQFTLGHQLLKEDGAQGSEVSHVIFQVDETPLSRPKRNIARDFSDGGVCHAQHTTMQVPEHPACSTLQGLYHIISRLTFGSCLQCWWRRL